MKKSVSICVCAIAVLLGAMAESAAQVPAEARAHYDAGMAAKKHKDLETAAKELRAAVALAPEWADAHWALAWTCAEQGEKQQAVDEFNSVIRLAPQSEQAEEARAAIQRLGGRVQPRPEAVSPRPVAREEVVAESKAAVSWGRIVPFLVVAGVVVCGLLATLIRAKRRAQQEALQRLAEARRRRVEETRLREQESRPMAEEKRRRVEEELRAVAQEEEFRKKLGRSPTEEEKEEEEARRRFKVEEAQRRLIEKLSSGAPDGPSGAMTEGPPRRP